MLQQILQDMVVDPELLTQLSDEQKQILFCKMREEQLRRYHDRETKDSIQPESVCPKNGRKIEFLNGEDGNVWVWVMGEHKSDRSIEDILSEEAREEARKLAEKETEEIIRRREEIEIKRLKDEESRSIEEENRQKIETTARLQEEERIRMRDRENVPKDAHEDFQEAKIRFRSNSERVKQDMIKRRSCEILNTFSEIRTRFEESAESEQSSLESSWRQREDQARKAEEKQKNLAREARLEHRRSLIENSDTVSEMDDVLDKLREFHKNNAPSSPEPSVISPPPPSPARRSFDRPITPTKRPLPARPARPYGRRSVVQWFRTEEAPRGVGIDPISGCIPPWFHGLISRGEAERMLDEKQEGSFLVRLSERIWGYAVSYKNKKGTCKHFLVELMEPSNRYRFFGTELQSFSSLCALVSNYKDKPISQTGNELLKYPVKQDQYPPNYDELFNHLSEENCSTNL